MSNEQEKNNDVKKEGFFSKKGKQYKEGFKDNINYRELSGTAGEIKDMASNILSPRQRIENARKEKFEEAVARKGLTDLDLIQNYKNLVLCFYSSIAFLFVCMGFMIYGVVTDFAIMHMLALLSGVIFCLANAFKFSFRSFQIKHRKLCSVSDWYKNGNYIPTWNIDKE